MLKKTLQLTNDNDVDDDRHMSDS